MSRGFTLVELLFTIAVMALLIGVAAPSFQNAVRNAAMTTSTNNIVASFQLARSEALKRRSPVTVCASSETDQCSDVDWQNGWIVFADDNGDGSRQPDEDIVHIEAKMGRDVTVTLPANQPLQNFLTYLPTGFPNLGGLNAAVFMLLCDNRQSDRYGRVIVISQTGRPQATAVEDRADLRVTCE